jgi:hypothetical protein
MERWVKALVATSLVASACAHPAPQAPSAVQKLPVSKPAPPVALTEHASFADVPMPAEVLAWLHMPAPGRDLPALGQMAGVGAFLDPNELVAQRLGPTLGAAVDLGKPFDVLGSDSLTLAFGVADAAAFAQKIEADYGLEHVAMARFRAVPRRPAGDSLTCELWLTTPPVGARLICSERPENLEKFAPFLLGSAQATAINATVHVEVQKQGLAYAVKKGALDDPKLPVSQSRSERAGNELGRGLVLDTVAAMSGVKWDVTLRDASIDISQQVELEKTDALLPLAVSGRAGAHPSVPDAFWRLPSDSDLAFYSEGADPAPLRKAWAQLVPRFVTGVDADLVVPDKASSEIEQALESLLFRGGAWEFAHGQDLRASGDALDAAKDLSATSPKSGRVNLELERVNAQLGGWFLIGLEDDPQVLLDSLRRGLKVASQDFPRRKDAAAEPVSPVVDKTSEVPLKNAAALPKGALHLVLTARPNSKYVAPPDGSKPPPLPSVWHLIAVPEAGQLWLSIAHDEATASSRLHALLTAEPSHSLGANEALRKLATTPPSGLGFVTAASFVGLSLSANSPHELLDSKAELSTLWATAGKGQTEIPVWVNAEGGGTESRRVTLNVRLKPPAFADILQLALPPGD